jgi:hypothetical protein
MESFALAAAPTARAATKGAKFPQGPLPSIIDFLSNFKTCRFLSIPQLNST